MAVPSHSSMRLLFRQLTELMLMYVRSAGHWVASVQEKVSAPADTGIVNQAVSPGCAELDRQQPCGEQNAHTTGKEAGDSVRDDTGDSVLQAGRRNSLTETGAPEARGCGTQDEGGGCAEPETVALERAILRRELVFFAVHAGLSYGGDALDRSVRRLEAFDLVRVLHALERCFMAAVPEGLTGPAVTSAAMQTLDDLADQLTARLAEAPAACGKPRTVSDPEDDVKSGSGRRAG